MFPFYFVKQVEQKNGWGYVFRTFDSLPILTKSSITYDDLECKTNWKIGLSLCSGCNVGCIYCFTNHLQKFRPLSVDEIVGQVEYILANHSPQKVDGTKIEMKEMGDPTQNSANVCESILRINSKREGLLFVVSTSGVKEPAFYEDLEKIRRNGPRIRLQFSCHTTDNTTRKKLSPRLNMLTFEEISEIIDDWYDGTERVTLNFVPFQTSELSSEQVMKLFDPKKVFIKISYVDQNRFTKAQGLIDATQSQTREFYEGLISRGFIGAYRHH
jgi:23S rRNA (adenine2503-C2)-methyltransferase